MDEKQLQALANELAKNLKTGNSKMYVKHMDLNSFYMHFHDVPDRENQNHHYSLTAVCYKPANRLWISFLFQNPTSVLTEEISFIST